MYFRKPDLKLVIEPGASGHYPDVREEPINNPINKTLAVRIATKWNSWRAQPRIVLGPFITVVCKISEGDFLFCAWRRSFLRCGARKLSRRAGERPSGWTAHLSVEPSAARGVHLCVCVWLVLCVLMRPHFVVISAKCGICCDWRCWRKKSRWCLWQP